jgi:hypothetical protein
LSAATWKDSSSLSGTQSYKSKRRIEMNKIFLVPLIVFDIVLIFALTIAGMKLFDLLYWILEKFMHPIFSIAGICLGAYLGILIAVKITRKRFPSDNENNPY